MGGWGSSSYDRPRLVFRPPRITPVTGVVLAANVLTFLADFFTQRKLFVWMAFSTRDFLVRPWTFLTYPLWTPGDFLTLLLLGYLFWWIGQDLERRWGTREFGLFLAAVTVLAALAFALGGLVLRVPVGLMGLWPWLAAPFLAWCMLNPDATVMFMLVIPIRARWLGYIEIGILYFGTGPVLGLFALLVPLGAWWWVARGRRAVLSWRVRRRADLAHGLVRPRGFEWNPLRWLERRRRRRQFERLMKISGLRDDEMRRFGDDDGRPN